MMCHYHLVVRANAPHRNSLRLPFFQAEKKFGVVERLCEDFARGPGLQVTTTRVLYTFLASFDDGSSSLRGLN